MVKPGSLSRVAVKNFVTYDEVVMYPGPNLNIILGPNGTGKSTIIAAIILGLGGTPKTIGRGSKISEYVRNNCTDASIDIELYGESPTKKYIISRKFNLNNQSTWQINGKNCTENDIKSLIKKLNIQVNNLCQILPQDRVQDFAKMDKMELLSNMQTAIGRQDLVEYHKQLIDNQKEQEKLNKDIDTLNKKLNQAELDNSKLEGEVKNFNESKKLSNTIENVKRKLSWLKYNKLQDEQAEVEKDLNKANEYMIKHEKKMQPTNKKIGELNNRLSNIQKINIKEVEQLKENQKKVKHNIAQIEFVQKQQRELYCEMQVKLTALKDNENEILSKKAKIDKLSNDHQDLVKKYGEETNLKEELNDIHNKIENTSRKIEEMDQKTTTLLHQLRHIENDINQLERTAGDMENLRSQRLEILRRRDKDAHSFVMWLRENKAKFSGNIYEPILIELDVFNQRHAKFLENMIPMRDRVAFTCETKEDMNLLLRLGRDQLGLKINALHSGPEHPPLSSYKSAIPIEQLQQYGLYAYTTSLFTAPEPIMKYLCRMYKLHDIPVGDQSTYKKSDHIPSEIKLFFSDNHRFFTNISRYTGEKSTRTSEVISDGTFAICVDLNAINKTKRELDIKKKEKEQMQQKCDTENTVKQEYLQKKTQFYERKRNVASILESFNTVKQQTISAKSMLKQFIQNSPTEETIRKSYGQQIKNSINTYLKKHESLTSVLSNYNNNIKTNNLLKEKINIIRNSIAFYENETINLREQYENAQHSYNKIKDVLRKVKLEVNDALTAALNNSDGFKPEDKGFSKYKQIYISLPNSEDVLNKKLGELQLKVSCMSTVDEVELAEYEKGLNLIESLRNSLNVITPRAQKLQQKQEALYQEWIVPLQELVNGINVNFGNYLESLGCAGEIEICKDKGDLNYEEYGLTIRVTYRKEDPLQELNSHTQSGGERAVATAIFMLSMQDLIAVPFRCVDEINQGMDPQNERRIFELLVTAVTKAENCQYFLVTPKLIPGLVFGDGMKVHIIFNGPYVNIKDKDYTFEKMLANNNN